jgi:hypothetical protein
MFEASIVIALLVVSAPIILMGAALIFMGEL